MTLNALFVTAIAQDPAATQYMNSQGLKSFTVPQLPAYKFWVTFNADPNLVANVQNSQYCFASMILP